MFPRMSSFRARPLRQLRPVSFAHRLAVRARRGVALFDVLLAIGLAGVVIVGVILLYQSIERSNARDDLVNLVRELRGGVERAFVGSGSYAGLEMELLCDIGAVPEANRIGTNCATARFVSPLSNRSSGSSLGTWPLTLPGGSTTPKGFTLGVAALDDADCAALVGAYVGRTWTRSDFFGATTVGAGPNGGANWDARTHGHFTGAPLTQAQAASMCGRGDGRNTVYLGFR